MRNKNSLERAIEELGVPSRDLYDLPTSSDSFPDGANYRMEISGIDSLKEMEALVDEKEKRNVPIHRVICMGDGTNILTKKDLKDLAAMGEEAGIELIVVPGPRANFDIGKHAETEWGKFSGVRLRGSDSVSYFLDEVRRCMEAGIKGFLFYGEDMIYLMDKLRTGGDLPGDLVFKLSYTAGVANPPGAKLAEEVGADSLNPVTDLTLPMLASLRDSITIPLDIVVVTFEILGNFNRFWETAEIVRTTSPCYLKQELESSEEGAREKVKYCQIITELIERRNPELELSGHAPDDLSIPSTG
jgi:hypothetical protein